jgi:hypothetical protein
VPYKNSNIFFQKISDFLGIPIGIRAFVLDVWVHFYRKDYFDALKYAYSFKNSKLPLHRSIGY